MIETRTDILIRRADASDARALTRLAVLDSAPVPHAGPDVLVAEVGGTIVAALHGDRIVADPFEYTQGLVQLLHLRARQVHATEPSNRLQWRRRRPRILRPLPQA